MEYQKKIKRILASLDQNDQILKAVALRIDNEALQHAKQFDEEQILEKNKTFLGGLPIAVKDIIDLQNHPTISGSKTRLQNPPATIDASVIKNLKAAGAIPVVKTQTVEFAIGGWGTNHTLGTPSNPWNTEIPHAPGGSSSGTGVLVGAGIVPAGLGTDTGGSIRIPASFCGCVGLKTSIGSVSRAGVTPLSETLDTIGPITQSVEIAAQMFQVMQGPDIKDKTTYGYRHQNVLRDLKKGISGMRLGVLNVDEMPHLSTEVLDCFNDAVDVLRDLGASLVPFSLPKSLDYYETCNMIISAVEGYATYQAIVEDINSELASPNRARLKRGKDITAHEFKSTMRMRDLDHIEMEIAMDLLDAIVLPTTPITAPPISEVDENSFIMSQHTRVANFLSMTGLSVPMKLASTGMPTGLQILGRQFNDGLVLRIGHAYETARGKITNPYF